MQSDILNTEVTTIDGDKTTGTLQRQRVAHCERGLQMWSDAAVRAAGEHSESSGERRLYRTGLPVQSVLGQEPGSEEEIKTFCSTTYGVTFPMFSKIDVNGENRHPLYAKLVAAAPTAVAPEGSGFYERMASKGRAPLYPDDILWNFEKFLIGRDGRSFSVFLRI